MVAKVITGGNREEHSKEILSGSLGRKTSSLYTFGSFTFITSGGYSHHTVWTRGCGELCFSKLNQSSIFMERLS